MRLPGIVTNVAQRSQQDLFDGDLLVNRLRQLGLQGVRSVEPHENTSVMVSVTPRGVLRIHRGYAYAPDCVLSAIVEFVRPHLRRRRRLALERGILDFPAHAFVPPRPRRRKRSATHRDDRPLLDELQRLHERLNNRFFHGSLQKIRFRVSRRMDRRLGELLLSADGNEALEIAISHRHIHRDGWSEVGHTLLHEMIHQWQAESGRPVDHGREFRRKAREVGVEPRAVRDVERARKEREQDGLF